jgi:hypothetical protein
MAADNATPVAASGQFRLAVVQPGSNAFSLIAPAGRPDESLIFFRMGRGQRIQLIPFAGVCFTMRTYKVKPAERLRDNESGAMGYSTCQIGSNYRIRSADDPPSK